MTKNIKMKNPIIEMGGDEMAQIIWEWIKNILIKPYIDLKTVYFDLGVKNRDKTKDSVTLKAAKAIKKYRVGVKCATITIDDTRVKEYRLKSVLPSPNGTIRNIIDGTVFREPILCKNIPKKVPSWTKPIIIGRHAFGDQYNAGEITIPGPGKLKIIFQPKTKKNNIQQNIHEFQSAGVGLGMFNIDKSIRSFARSCFNLAVERKWPLFLSTKQTILKKYDGRFRDIFDKMYKKEFLKKFKKLKISYEHKLTDDMVAATLRSNGGFIWACKNYDGDVQSDFLAQGYGSLGMMSSILLSPNGKIVESEAAHGTIRSHFMQHKKNKKTSTNPVASIFAWTKAISYRGKFDKIVKLQKFSTCLEEACIITIERGIMTKDLALLVGPKQKWVTTEEFLNSTKKELEKRL
ncbi:MAG: NADP-dependent isocitrate dehydrogenase [Pseudomonadota bacterium]|nr:NADP-dependent isocitrate dehydrogenase [Pseudomonadota bacterium]